MDKIKAYLIRVEKDTKVCLEVVLYRLECLTSAIVRLCQTEAVRGGGTSQTN